MRALILLVLGCVACGCVRAGTAPESVTLLAEGRRLLATGHSSEGVAVLRICVQRFPRDAECWRELAAACARTGPDSGVAAEAEFAFSRYLELSGPEDDAGRVGPASVDWNWNTR